MMNMRSKLALASRSFEPGGYIPQKYTCDGEDISPELSWDGAPEGTETYTLIVDDPDAPGRVFTHWVVYNIPGTVKGFEEGMSAFKIVKTGASQGKNDFGQTGYGGPCPPPGKPHHYHFRLYALDGVLDIPSGLSKSTVLSATKGHVLAETEIVGLYKRA
jgi:Raf kinase inhibitor-like YbhB/YbcL family protein